MLSLPEQGPGVWEDEISHTKHCCEKARSKLKQAIKKIKGKTLAVFLHCCLAIAMTQAKLSQNPLTHNHRQTLHTQVTGTALPRSAARPAQPLQTQQGEASPGTARQGCQAPRPCLSCSVPSTKPQAHLQQELWGCRHTAPQTQHVPGAGSAGLSARGSSSELICASTRNAQNEKNVVPSSIGIPSPDINTTRDIPSRFCCRECLREAAKLQSHTVATVRALLLLFLRAPARVLCSQPPLYHCL